jgi:hypothetical protein
MHSEIVWRQLCNLYVNVGTDTQGEVLKKLYDDNSTILNGEAMEKDHLPFLGRHRWVEMTVERFIKINLNAFIML